MSIKLAAFLSRFFSPLLVLALVLEGFAGAATTTTATTNPTLAHLVGQKLVIRMDGTTPSASLLGRVREVRSAASSCSAQHHDEVGADSAISKSRPRPPRAASRGCSSWSTRRAGPPAGSVAGPTLSARQMEVDSSVDLVTQQGSSSRPRSRVLGQCEFGAGRRRRRLVRVVHVEQARTFGFSDTLVGRLALPLPTGRVPARDSGLQALPGYRPGDAQYELKVVIGASKTT